MQTITIQSGVNAAAEFQLHFVLNSKPVLVTGLPLTMPAYSKWTWEYLQEIGQTIEIGLASDPLKRGIVTSKTTLANYAAEVHGNTAELYMVGWPFESNMPELNHDYQHPEFHPADFIDSLPANMRFRRRWIFVGRKDLYSDLHVDCFTTNGWLMVTSGQKTVRMLSPLQRELVTPTDSLFDEELIARLEAAGAEIHELVLTPGSLGYIPSGWMHHVRNDTNTIMVTGNWSSYVDVLRFYPNFRSLISRDVSNCDKIYTQFIDELELTGPLSPEIMQALEVEIERYEVSERNLRKTLDRLHALRPLGASDSQKLTM